jgi:hypothetical protein
VAGKNKREAVDNFAGCLRESLSCISDSYLLVYQQSANIFKIFYEQPVPLDSTEGLYLFSVVQICSAQEDTKYGGFKAKTRNYSYTLIRVPSRGETEEVLSYHWHPEDSALREPHLHLGSIPRVHFPTSRISLEDVIEMLIKYYGIMPKLAHSEWRRILEKNKRAFDQMATWKEPASRS